MWMSPPTASAMNQTTVMGPKNARPFSVPRDLHGKERISTHIDMGSTNFSNVGETSSVLRRPTSPRWPG